jgi:hypothetical protein
VGTTNIGTAALTNLGAFTSNGGFTLVDAGGLNVTGAVSDSSGPVSITTDSGNLAVTNTGSVTGNGVTLTTTTSGDITLAGNVNAGAGTATLDASAGGAVTETTGAVTANSLLVKAVNSSVLMAANNVNTVAANITGPSQSFSYTDANSVVIGLVGTTNGITTSSGNVTINAGDNITLINSITGVNALNLNIGQANSGGILNLSGSLGATTINANGGTGDDTFNVNTTNNLTLDGANGSDIYFVTLGANGQVVTINDTGTVGTDIGSFSSGLVGTGANDKVIYTVGASSSTGNSGNLDFTNGGSTQQNINFAGLEPVELLGPITSLDMNAWVPGTTTINEVGSSGLVLSSGLDPYTGLNEKTYLVNMVGADLRFRNVGTLTVNGTTTGSDLVTVDLPTTLDGANIKSKNPLTTVNVNGVNGTDTFTVNSVFSGLSLNLFGGPDADTLNGSTIINVALSGSGANGYAGDVVPNPICVNCNVHFTDINTLTGSGTLTVENVTTGTWTLLGGTSGTYDDGTGQSPLPLNFSGFYILHDPTTGKYVFIEPLVEPFQPTTLFTQAADAMPSPITSQLAQVDSQQALSLTSFGNDYSTSGEISQLWGNGNGPAVTILDGGVRMPGARDEEGKDLQ